MVSRSANPCQTGTLARVGDPGDDWKGLLAGAFRDVPALLQSLGLEAAQIPDLDPTPEGFRVLVPRGFAALMGPGDPTDPLLRQVLPLGVEREPSEGFGLDPVGDWTSARRPGLIQKYQGRALLMVQGACAVHCRYCFRRHYPYAELGPRDPRIRNALATIAADQSLCEIILSGGDPMLLDDGPFSGLLMGLERIPHLRRLRIHSRVPVVLPERVTGTLCGLLRRRRLAPVLVIHANHPRELGPGAAAALARLATTGLTLLNQSVLLRGVNDRADILAELGERLFDLGVLPYYLHQLDPVQGAAHFQVPDPEAQDLLESLRSSLPGYLIPRLVREVPGESSKRPL